MKLHDIMVRKTECVGPNDTLAAAKAVMRRDDVQVLPVLDHHHVSGVVTGRKIETQSYATGRRPAQMRVREAMDTKALWLNCRDEADEALKRMEEHGVAELPVVDDEERVVGVITRESIQAALSKTK
jgi:CBS domain-containing protein